MTSSLAPTIQTKRQRLNLLEMMPDQGAARASILAGLDLIAQPEAVAKVGAL